MARVDDKPKRSVIITALVAGLLVVVANSAIWVNQNFFNTDRFTQIATTSLTSPSSTNAIAAEITERALADYPRVESVVGDTASSFIGGLLGSPRSQHIVEKAVNRLQLFLTSPQKAPVVVNLESAKEVMTRLIAVSGREGQTRVDPADIPDEVTIIDPSKYPNFYQYGITMTWLGLLAGLAALGLLIWPYIENRQAYKQYLLIQGLSVAAFGLLALILGPLFRPMLLGNVESANIRVVVGNLYDAFLHTFNTQTAVIVVVGVAAVVASLTIRLIQKYRQT